MFFYVVEVTVIVCLFQLEAYLAVSSDSLVVIQDNNHHDILFVAACK